MFFPGPNASTQQILDFDPIKYLQSSNKNNNANKITTSKEDEEDLGYESQELLNKYDREAVITANIDLKSIDAQKSAGAGKVEVRGEKDHLTDHKDNI